MAVIASDKQKQQAADRVISDTKKGAVPPRRIFLNKYTADEIAKNMPAAGCLYGARGATALLPQAPRQGRPGFYKDQRDRGFVDEPETEKPAVDVSGEEKTRITLDVIELMTKNSKLTKTKLLEALDEISPDHGLEAEKKDIVVAALTKAQVEGQG